MKPKKKEQRVNQHDEAIDRLDRIYKARQEVVATKLVRDELRKKMVEASHAHAEALHKWELLAAADNDPLFKAIGGEEEAKPVDPEVSQAASTMSRARKKKSH
jgi:hypothetical protein